MTTAVVTPPACIQPDDWLAAQLGCPSFIVNELVHAEAGELPRYFDSHETCFASLHIATHRTEELQYAQQLGFRVVDVNVTLERPLLQDPGDLSDMFEIRCALESDEDAVAALAAEFMTGSRFHLDPAIEMDTASRIKSAWSRNFFRGCRGDRMIIARAADHLAGFLLAIRTPDETLITDLIVVHPADRGCDLPCALTHAAQQAVPGVHRLRIGTQVSNIPAMRCYTRMGYHIVNSRYVLHYHRSSSSATEQDLHP